MEDGFGEAFKAAQPMKKLLILLFFSLSGTLGAQSLQESVLEVESYSEFLGKSFEGRQNLHNAIVNSDTALAKKLRKLKLVYTEGEFSRRFGMLTPREDILVHFYVEDYRWLLDHIRWAEDFFQKPAKLWRGYPGVNSEAPNLSLDLIDYWQENTSGILAAIKRSGLSKHEKQVLQIYWKAIIDYLLSKDQLSEDLKNEASDLAPQFVSTEYESFLQQLSTRERYFAINGMSLGFSYGKPYLTGDLQSALKGTSAFSLTAGYTFRKLYLELGFNYFSFTPDAAIPLQRIDTMKIEESTEIGYYGFISRLGYKVLETERLLVQPFVGFTVNKLENVAESTTDTIRQKSKSYPAPGVGIDFSYAIFKNTLSVEGNSIHFSRREEMDRAANPLFISAKLGYYPEVFFRPAGASDGLFYWSLGLTWIVGERKAHYRYR